MHLVLIYGWFSAACKVFMKKHHNCFFSLNVGQAAENRNADLFFKNIAYLCPTKTFGCTHRIGILSGK